MRRKRGGNSYLLPTLQARLGRTKTDAQQMVKIYKDKGFLLDDLSCCESECAC